MAKKTINTKKSLTRRNFGKAAFAGIIGGNALICAGAKRDAHAMKIAGNNPPGIKLAAQVAWDPGEEDLTLVNQLGVDNVTMRSNAQTATYENYSVMKKKVESRGLKIWNIGNLSTHNMEEVTLNLSGREEKIDEYLAYLRNIAKAGIYYTTYAHMGNGIWSTEAEETQGGARARAFDLAKAKEGQWNGKIFSAPLTHGRKYTEDEIWENFRYFIEKVVPVAEETGVRIGIHPDDPPVPELGGIPRCIFGSFEGYRKALEIADSPNVGMCLCVGCWLEGGELMGKNVIDTIRYFGERKKIFKVHFRNVNEPLPHFVETLMDNGYMDMYKVMKALRDVDYDGVIIADHVPGMVGGGRVGLAYSIGYMKALLERANEEKKG